jgi:hypothetical protein
MSRVWGDDATGGLYVAKAFEDDSLVTSYSGGLSSGADGVGGPLNALVAESEKMFEYFLSARSMDTLGIESSPNSDLVYPLLLVKHILHCLDSNNRYTLASIERTFSQSSPS